MAMEITITHNCLPITLPIASLPTLSAVDYPSFDDLGHAAEQRLSQSVNNQAAHTADSRFLHFINYLEYYNKTDDVLSADRRVVDDIVTNYAVFFLSGHTIKNIYCVAGTLKGYLKVMNEWFEHNDRPAPFKLGSNSRAARLIAEQEAMEKEPDRRRELPDRAIVKMMLLAKDEDDALGFRACVWDITGLGRFGGFRQQEYAMDAKSEIKYYVKPDGSYVVRAFTLSNISFRDKEAATIHHPLQNEDACDEIGTEYDIQKNRVNGQVVFFRREDKYPAFCPVRRGLSLVRRAVDLGQESHQPLCVYRDAKGKHYLTRKDITQYYRFVVKLIQPNIAAEELKLISSHSLRVTACVLLAEAGKEGWYIKLRLRWLSDCYEVYIRNTRRITWQHMEALSDDSGKMQEVAISMANLPDILAQSGVASATPYNLEDED